MAIGFMLGIVFSWAVTCLRDRYWGQKAETSGIELAKNGKKKKKKGKKPHVKGKKFQEDIEKQKRILNSKLGGDKKRVQEVDLFGVKGKSEEKMKQVASPPAFKEPEGKGGAVEGETTMRGRHFSFK
jgi:hypothetical protein